MLFKWFLIGEKDVFFGFFMVGDICKLIEEFFVDKLNIWMKSKYRIIFK